MSEGLCFFGVRNRDGQWFRRKGYGGSGDSWVVDLKKARIYNKIGPARAVVSFFAERYPSYGVPAIVEFKVQESRVIDETERFQKKQQLEMKKAGTRKIEMNRERLQRAQEDFRKAQEEFLEASAQFESGRV
jgi:hypothetical protein